MNTIINYKLEKNSLVKYIKKFKKFLLNFKRFKSSRAKQKEEERMRSIPAGRLYSHLASEQDTTGPGQSPAQDVFF